MKIFLPALILVLALLQLLSGCLGRSPSPEPSPSPTATSALLSIENHDTDKTLQDGGVAFHSLFDVTVGGISFGEPASHYTDRFKTEIMAGKKTAYQEVPIGELVYSDQSIVGKITVKACKQTYHVGPPKDEVRCD